jgi:hypothetical protein
VANGIAFSPDYSKVYLCWGRNLAVAEVEGAKIANLRTFTDCMVDGVKCGPDGHRVDAYGNVWSGSTAPLGYCGVTVWNPQGKLIGRIQDQDVGIGIGVGRGVRPEHASVQHRTVRCELRCPVLRQRQGRRGDGGASDQAAAREVKLHGMSPRCCSDGQGPARRRVCQLVRR